MNEFLGSDVIFVIGSNTTENHPVIGAKIRQAVRKGAKLVVADPRRIDLAHDSEVFLQIKPGTNVALLNGMMHVILKENLHNKEFIADRTENFEKLEETIKSFTPEKAAKICGVSVDDIEAAAKLYAKAKKGSIVYCMGITQHTTGVNNVMNIANLAMLCGQIGRESTGVNPLRGQNNVQGACDMGALPGTYTGYQQVTSQEIADKFATLWGVEALSTKSGLTVSEMMHAAEHGDIKMLYIMGENPMISDPDLNHVKHALESTEFLVVQDIFLTETAQLADVVFPAAAFAEKDGTFTNTERRVQRVRKAISAPGEAKADWQIIMKLMNKLGYDRYYKNPSEIFDEMAALTPTYAGIDYERLEIEGIQWPCLNKEHPGTPYLHQDTFIRGKGLFMGIEYQESAELPDERYPLILTTGRVLYQYHTRTMTGRVEGLNKKSPESFVQLNPATAINLKIRDGELVKVSSRRGSILVKAKVSDIVEQDVVFIPFHFAEGAANILTNSAFDPTCKTPELKVCSVSIEKCLS
ncbi:MAG: fdhA2, partial [Clostridia bacterium]|nr:fdhA2 [Clostridia bacterium]